MDIDKMIDQIIDWKLELGMTDDRKYLKEYSYAEILSQHKHYRRIFDVSLSQPTN